MSKANYDKRRIFIRATFVATVVGPILTLINQFDAIFGPQDVSMVQFLLTLMVPFCVSSFSGILSLPDIRKLREKAEKFEKISAILKEDKDPETEEQPQITQENAPSNTFEFQITGRPNGGLERSGCDGPVLDYDSLNQAGEIISQIQSNAKKVNSSSVERVQFIAGLIERANNLNATVRGIQEESSESQNSIEKVNSGIDEISNGVVSLSEQIMNSVSGLQNIKTVTSEFERQFGLVKTTCESIREFTSAINMVSINASIEATRAGDLGKGFSLIASEVRDLSNRSRIDLEEINQEIEKLETSLRSLVTAIDTISDSALKTSETSDYFKQRTLDLAGETKGLSGRIYSASSAVASQLPAVSALIDDIKQIKANTEAAVVGSQTNIELCDQTLTNLKLAQNDNQSRQLIAS